MSTPVAAMPEITPPVTMIVWSAALIAAANVKHVPRADQNPAGRGRFVGGNRSRSKLSEYERQHEAGLGEQDFHCGYHLSAGMPLMFEL